MRSKMAMRPAIRSSSNCSKRRSHEIDAAEAREALAHRRVHLRSGRDPHDSRVLPARAAGSAVRRRNAVRVRDGSRRQRAAFRARGGFLARARGAGRGAHAVVRVVARREGRGAGIARCATRPASEKAARGAALRRYECRRSGRHAGAVRPGLRVVERRTRRHREAALRRRSHPQQDDPQAHDPRRGHRRVGRLLRRMPTVTRRRRRKRSSSPRPRSRRARREEHAARACVFRSGRCARRVRRRSRGVAARDVARHRARVARSRARGTRREKARAPRCIVRRSAVEPASRARQTRVARRGIARALSGGAHRRIPGHRSAAIRDLQPRVRAARAALSRRRSEAGDLQLSRRRPAHVSRGARRRERALYARGQSALDAADHRGVQSRVRSESGGVHSRWSRLSAGARRYSQTRAVRRRHAGRGLCRYRRFLRVDAAAR